MHKKACYTIFLLIVYFFAPCNAKAQLCNKDSNYYLLNYTGGGNNFVKDAIITANNEVVALCQYDAFSAFMSKFTAQGSVIWSNEFTPDYPHDTWVQFPWYNLTEMLGIVAGLNDTYYTFGYSTEHGKSINNVEDPPTHKVGIVYHFDKYGNKIGGKYFGNWRTDYSVSGMLQLPGGNIIVYLRSHFTPKISKVLCVNEAGGIIWAAPIQCNSLISYDEVDGALPVLQQLKNGNIVVARIMQRDIADTIQYPFTPPIIVPAPIHYFNLFELNGENGDLVWQNSYQCPTLTNTNVSNTYIPQLKNITQLPNGNLSFAADMYLQLDTNERFYAYKVFSKRAANFITTADGFNLKLISYFPQNGACSLEKAMATGSNGQQLFVTKDSAMGNTILFKIDAEGQITWSQAYANNNNSPTAQCTAVEKKSGPGYIILQSDANSPNIKSVITDAAGNTGCAKAAIEMMTRNSVWPWLVDKVHLANQVINIDFRYSNFDIKQSAHPLQQRTDCQYQYVCCTDFIDSLHPHEVLLCKNQTYTLPDNSVVKDSGTYYATFKTTRGCDSILFYNVKIIPLPSDLTTTPDTCMKNAISIQLRASEGFDKYLWNNSVTTTLPSFAVNAPGTYTVKVENKCGAKTDTINVYPQCEFPVYFPNAFTPNNDFINDILKVPALNKNKLVRLTIYNRYGQIVFNTDNIKNGWDGKYKGIAQENGAYGYLLEMEGFSGKPILQRGTVILIR